MKTFDYEQVNDLLTPLKAKFKDCAHHGEGNQCETLDKHLECCAMICFEVAMALRGWWRDVFTGEVVFDPEAEGLWQSEIAQIHAQATKIWQAGRKAEVPCWELPGQQKLQAALWQLQWLLGTWVSPKRSVGPAPRMKLAIDEDDILAIRKQISLMPPLDPSAKKKKR